MKTAEEYQASYAELVGFVPPKTVQRVSLGLECDPKTLDLVEQIRDHALNPDSMDLKTAQLMIFGILLSHISPAAEFHARACKRAGATKKELHDVAAMTFIFRGLPAINLGAEIINKIYDEDEQEK